MKSPTLAGRALAVATATVLLVLSGSMAWAVAYEYQTRTRVPKGVSVAGRDLAGLDADSARIAIAAAVTEPLMRPLAVVADGKQFTFDPQGAVMVDTDTMISDAYAPRRRASFIARLRHDLAGIPMTTVIEPRYSIDETAVATWVGSVAKKIDRPAVDATVTVASGEVTITPSRPGRAMKGEAAVAMIREAFTSAEALTTTNRTVTLPVDELTPAVREQDLGKTIVVDLSQRRIRLFDGAALEKSYPCAIGTPSFPTPTGHFVIEQKRYRPTWVNPAPNGWGKGMPAFIPPGPSNPLGTRALNLSAPGIRFHGTSKLSSIGTAASHGCMRMYRHDIEDLYERVEVGTQVYIFD